MLSYLKYVNSRKTSASLTTLKPLCRTQKTGKNHKEMEIPDLLITCFLLNLYADQEATIRTGHGTTDWFKIGKGVHQDCILSPGLFNFYAEHICEMLGWMNHMLESRLSREISTTSDMQMMPFNGRK